MSFVEELAGLPASRGNAGTTSHSAFHICSRFRNALLATTALIATVALASPASANGGSGGGGAAGGTTNTTSAGGGGGNSNNGSGGGGGGGGAGTTGGSGGFGNNGDGGGGGGSGAAVNGVGQNGGGGSNGQFGVGGGGGGGGSHGYVNSTLPTIVVMGGKGGNGASGGIGGGGGGGAGGYGAVVTGTGSLGTLNTNVTGGAGGNGGANGAVGGDGGIGLFFTNGAGATFTIGGGVTIQGGARGTGGNAVNGAGISGQNLTVTLSSGATVAGGGTGNAFTFTGGSNSLTFNGATSGLTGGIGVAGTLTFSQSTDITLSNVISGAGGAVTKTGNGILTLSGANTYTGATSVSQGTLNLTGSLATTPTTVGSGATFTGTGSSAGSVALQAGGTIAPGAGGAGTFGTLTTGGFSTAGTMSFDLGTPGVVGGASNDLIQDNGALVLGGTLAVNQRAGFGEGTYRIVNYTGALTNNGLTVTGAPSGSIVQAGAGQVNLLVAGVNGITQYWNGSTTTANGTINGGTGSWTNAAANTNWTDATGTFAESWASGSAVFGGTAGTVTVNDTISYRTLRFSTTGYRIAAGTGTLTATDAGSVTTDTGVTATIAAPIAGTVGLSKLGAGTLVLAGANTYTGGTTISAGTLQLGDGTSNGSVVGTITDNGVLVLNPTGSQTFANVITGTGSLQKIGTGTATLSGTNTYSGGTTISAGTLSVSSDTNLGVTTGGLTFAGGTLETTANGFSSARAITLDTAGTVQVDTAGNTTTLSGIIADGSGAGSLAKTGAGTLALSAANTYTGATAISAGTLTLTGSGSVAQSSGVAADGTFDISGTTAGASIKTLSGSGTATLGAQTLTVTAGSTTFSGAIGGAGGLTLSGGTQTLSSSNGYTGATTISAGTLALSGNASIRFSSGVAGIGTLDISDTTRGALITTLSGSGTVALGDKSLLVTNGSTEFSGVIQDGGIAGGTTGGIEIFGGTQTLSGANTYTNATQIDNGATLALKGGGSVATSAYVGIAGAGTFDISQTTSGASIAGLFAQSAAAKVSLGSKTLTLTGNVGPFAGVIQDGGIGGGTGGAVTVAANGTATFSGTNTFTGATTISANGEIDLTGGGSIATSSGVTADGVLDISGKTSDATIKTLSGASTGQVNLGSNTLNLSNASGSFAGTLGQVGDTGGFTLTSGTQTLSGTGNYTGATSVKGGTLTLTGTLAATPTTVALGATLAGTGTTGGSMIVNGTLSPGVAGTNNGVGTLTVNAPVTFSAGATYNVAITPLAASRTNVTGVATLGNATVNVAAGMGTYMPSTKYTILTATGGFANSRFNPTVTTNLAFLRPALSYDMTNVFLTVLPPVGSTPDYTTAAATGNQRGIASGLTFAGILAGAGSNNPVLNGLNQLTSAQAQAAFDSLTGEGITGAQNVALRASHLFSSAISDLMVFYGSGGANSVTVPATAPLAYAPVNALKTPIAVRDPIAARALYTWRAWGTGFGASETIRTNPVLGTAQQNNGIGGGAVGVDYQWAPGMISGIALGGSDGSFAVGARNTYGSTTGGHAAFYTLANFGPVYAASTTSVSVFGNRTTRNIAGFGGLAPETERGNFSSSELRSRVEFGYRFETGFGATLTPFIAVEAAQLRSNGFNETAIAGAGLFALNVKGQTSASVPMFAGARLTGLVDLGGGLYLRPSIQGAFVRENAPVRSQIAGLVSLPGAVFLTDGARPSRNAAQVKAGAELAVLDNVSLSANFDGEFSGRAQTYAGKGAIRVSW